MTAYEIIPLRQEWIKQASDALNRLNKYMFEHGVYSSEQTAPPFCDSTKFLTDLQKGHLSGFLVVEKSSQKLAAVLTYSVIPDPAFDNGIFPFISNIWVEPEHRHRGLGKNLTLAVQEKENTKHLVLVCGEQNPSRKIFASWGFKKTSLHFMSLGYNLFEQRI